uniref:Uncharacterized protein LOC105123888 isoform X3 n=1 Tax=Rhizophora mucronata TaxID=61149 RepID=A0A2P2LNY5_RHIMU
MDYSLGGENPAILQLHKWNPSQFQYNLSEFREVFISPSRELLLLLSYHCEALLLPLVSGESINCNETDNCYGKSLQNQSSGGLFLQSVSESSRSDSKEEFQSSSASVVDFDNGFSLEHNFSRSNDCPFVCDVNSLAWGSCADPYNQHKDASFRELLFVSGSHGVSVHAFCEPSKINLTTQPTLESECGQGRWVHWGPPSALETVLQDSLGMFSDETGPVIAVNTTNGNSETPQDVCKEAGVNEMSCGVASKRWLRSFFTKAETTQSDGCLWTRFPDKQSFPCSADVVSFRLFNCELPALYFLSSGKPKKENWCQTTTNLQSDTVKSKSNGLSGSSHFGSYKCSRVFSSNSFDLIGFVLTLVSSISVDTVDESEGNEIGNLVLVARLGCRGIQWISLVKLEKLADVAPVSNWTDFCFSDNLLVCLNPLGLIYFYSTTSGNFVAHVNVLEACGLNPQSGLQQREIASVAVDGQTKEAGEVHGQATSQDFVFSSRRIFKKLLVASHNSLLAAVDEYGVIYVICAGDYLPENYYAFEKLFPCFQCLRLGMLVGWQVGGSNIGHHSLYPNKSSMKNSDVAFRNYTEDNNVLQTIQKSDFCTKGNQDDSEVHCRLMRSVFLPIERLSEDDCVCFSPLGITRLVKKCNTRNQRTTHIVHVNLYTDSAIYDDRCLDSGGKFLRGNEDDSVVEAVGGTFQGCFYLVNEVGLSVVLPSISVSSSFLPVEAIGYRQQIINIGVKRTQDVEESKELFSPWKVEVLDRVLLYEGPEEADWLCLQNGWDLKLSRLRRLQVALDYLKFEDTEKSLEMLVGVNLAEEGILRVLFAAVYLMLCRKGTDNEFSAASKLLALATQFTTRMIRKYGLLQHAKAEHMLQGSMRTKFLTLPPMLSDILQSRIGGSRRLHDMAHLLEIIRNLQCHLNSKFKKPGQGLVDGNMSQDESQSLSAEPLLLEAQSQQQEESMIAASFVDSNNEKLALVFKDSLDSRASLDEDHSNGVSVLMPQGHYLEKKVFALEKPKEMIARWKLSNLDLKTVVKDALLSGRLPLAVLQLHLHRSGDLNMDKVSPDTFSEVHHIGRAIAYDLLLKGETVLAISTLQRLGEDIEACLRQLLFGTVRRSLRIQVAEEMRRCGHLGQYECKILDRMILIERLYPSCGFWETFIGRKKALSRSANTYNLLSEIKLHVSHSPLSRELFIQCGDIDGVVLGLWTSINENPPVLEVDEDVARAGYWAAAAVWCSAWDQQTIDHIVLDQPFLLGVHVLWESQLEYYACHNDWEEVSKLLDLIPTSVLSDGRLQIALDGISSAPSPGCGSDLPEHGNLLCSVEELDAACMDVPGVKVFEFSQSLMCTMWLRMLMEQDLARKFIFLKKYWEGTGEFIALLARSGFIITRSNQMPLENYELDNSSDLDIFYGRSHFETVQALDKLFVHHCVQYNLPNLLDLYLGHHQLVSDTDSLYSLLEAAGDCQWAKWLLLSRVRGHEYDASFCNARSTISCNLISKTNRIFLEIDEIIHTVDDIAEAGGEMAALATLMYAPYPIQSCLNSGSVNRHDSSSAQCTLENLRPSLQRFPTLWRTLVAAGLHQNGSNILGRKANNALVDYLNWRDNIFYSSTRDTSLLQMLPCWFPKSVRRLIQLYMKGPLGWESLSDLPTGDSLLHRDIDFCIHAGEHTKISAISWEATIQKHVQDELYDSSLEESGHGIEHHLHRGRALAAFNHIIGARVQKLKLEGQSSKSHGQTNIQSDLQTFLAPITQSEKPFFSSVIPLAIAHFDNNVLVASCAFLLELCGLSANMLRVDVAALRRISSFYKLNENERHGQFSPKSPAYHAIYHEGDMVESLARSLADDYVHKDCTSDAKTKDTFASFSSKQPSRAVMLVLQHLEKASVPSIIEGNTCGSWLLTGSGDGAELRFQQKVASQRWNLVTAFCQMHQLPLSTKYLAVLARDNDWVGFLSEAQIGGYPYDTVVQVASREFLDPHLRVHILTVLKGMQSRKRAVSPAYSDVAERSESSCSDESVLIPAELFRILRDCEKQRNPGGALLRKAKEMSWSILAMIASCFPDVSSLSCLTVWLEITAARETSSIKVNDIASQIADNVRAAVEAINSLPAASRGLIFHYNRQNPKRRRLMEPMSVDLSVTGTNISSGCGGEKRSVTQGVISEVERNLEVGEHAYSSNDSDDGLVSLSKMVAVLCEQQLFPPLLRAFEMFLPSCSLLPFIRALQAFSQMRLSEALAHLGSFSGRIKDEPSILQSNMASQEQIGLSWICSTAVKAADAILSSCPSPYERRCLLQLLSATDFGDGGSAATYYRRLYWKINLAEPSLRKDNNLNLGNESLDDTSLLVALEKNGHWDEARNWARQLEASGGPWNSAVHHVTETQAESMVAEWKEFLWDVPEERVALWNHCQRLFIRYSFPPLQAGLFFLKHAEAVEKDLPTKELHELLLLSLQWLSGMITLSNPVYPMHLLREIETRVWLLAVESEAQVKSDGDFTTSTTSSRDIGRNTSNIIDKTANLITKMDNHINAMRNRTVEKNDARENNLPFHMNQVLDATSHTTGGNAKTKRRAKGYVPSRRPLMDPMDKNFESEDGSTAQSFGNGLQLHDENMKKEMSFSRWEERVGPAELERAVLSLLEFGQVTAAKQLQLKLSPAHAPSEFKLVDVTLKLAALVTPTCKVSLSVLDEEVCSVVQSHGIYTEQNLIDPLEVLESLATFFAEGSGRRLCKRIIAVVKGANVLGLSFSEAFDKQPIELLQLLSLKAQESFEEAYLLVQTHSMPAASIAQILAESFLKGLLAAHRGGYIDSQKEEGPAPLLWRFSDFLKWAELCPSEPEIGHALMRLVITGQEIPHACEVELLILSHHFYKSSACLDGVDVLVALAATRVEAYVSEGDFPCLARLITGVGNFHALNFILGILIENGQLDLLLQKYSAAADTNAGTAEAVRGFRMAVLTSLKHFNPKDLDAFAMVCISISCFTWNKFYALFNFLLAEITLHMHIHATHIAVKSVDGVHPFLFQIHFS